MEHEGGEFLGEYMARILKDCMGMTIESIGSLGFPLAFETSKKLKLCRELASKVWFDNPYLRLRDESSCRTGNDAKAARSLPCKQWARIREE